MDSETDKLVIEPDNMTLLAHRSTDGRVQTLAQHLLGVSARTAQYSLKLHLESAGAVIGLLHDLGKATELFQKYLTSFDPENDIEPQDELRGKIDHSTAGAQFLKQVLASSDMQGVNELIPLLALPIVSHHSGLINCVDPDGKDKLAIRLKKSDTETRSTEAWQTLDAATRARATELLSDPMLLKSLRRSVSRILDIHHDGSSDRRHFHLGMLVRMLFSCLIDADRTDTANFENATVAGMRQEGEYTSWDTLLLRLNEALQRLPGQTAVNQVRQHVSDTCFRAASRPTGGYTLTVPTGGGKTLAALRFALEHARTHGLERIAFVSPYISIVDQNAAVARAILEPSSAPFASVVLEHHSNLAVDASSDRHVREHWRRSVMAENWDAPVVFTTMVQVLEALFGGGTRSVRRLHALAKAVIVFDEAQTLPLNMIHLFNNGVNFLSSICGSTVLLCTATQPMLHTVDKDKGAFQLSSQPELMDDIAGLFHALRRYTVDDQSARPGGWTQSEVADLACVTAQRDGNCLVIVNTQRDARELYQCCRDHMPEARLIHISTGMCPEHRMQTLNTLRVWLSTQAHGDNGQPILCVSTQLIEAGVDIDFAAVIRDLAGLDSIAQAAGRCNRNGSRGDGGHVTIVKLPDPPKKLREILIGRMCATRVLDEWRRSSANQPFPLDDPKQMELYFRYLLYERSKEMAYNVSSDKAERDDTLLSMLGANEKAVEEATAQGKPIHRQLFHQSFMKAGEAFEVIAPTQGIVVPFKDDGKEIVAQLCAAHDLQAEWQTRRKAQRYTVSIYDHRFQRLLADGAVYEVKEGTGVFCLQPEWYEDDFGLRSEAGALEDLFA